jgi:hypothetical protein
MAQHFNYQTYYTDKEEQLDLDLQYYRSPGINGIPDEFKKPDVFRGLYNLAWDYFALNQDTVHNSVVYALDIARTPGLTVPPGDARDPAAIATDTKKEECIELYCKNMGIVIGAKILAADNLDEVIEWVKDNDVFPATLPLVGVYYRPLAIGAGAAAAAAATAAIAQVSGADAIHSYADNFCQAKIATTPALASSIRTELLVRLNAHSAAKLVECQFFQAQMRPFNAGGLDNAATIGAYNAAQTAYVGNAATGLQFNGSIFIRDLLLNMTRNTVATRQTYNFVKNRMNSVPVSFSSFKEIESNIGTLNNQVAIAPIAPVQASQKTTGLFTGVGYNSIIDRLKTDMPRRLTHTCFGNCSNIYGVANPTVRVMSIDRKVYVAPIQTRLNNVNTIHPSTVGGLINTFEATAVAGLGGLSPPLPTQAVYTNIGGTNPSIDVLNRLNAMPGPNPQPLKTNFFKTISTDNPSQCTTNVWDLENMRALPFDKISTSSFKNKGHGDWQSIPNYATCWCIKHTDKRITPTTSGVDMTTQSSSTIKVFPFLGRFAIPYDSDNCVLPSGWEMFALWPTGKIIYRSFADNEFTVQPPKGSYWKEFREAEYDVSYMAEIGYQQAKAAYDARPAAQKTLSLDQQIELFQMGAHDKMEEYVGTKNAIRLAGIAALGGSGNNNKKRYNKKTVMSMLKTAKRRYFTRRNKTKQ